MTTWTRSFSAPLLSRQRASIPKQPTVNHPPSTVNGAPLFFPFIYNIIIIIIIIRIHVLTVELCADVIVSAAARRSISVGGGGAPPVQKNRRRRRRGAAWTAQNFFSKIHEKISFYPQNFLRNFFRDRKS